MQPFDINSVLGFALGYLLAQAIRYASKSAFWRGVEAKGRAMLADPTLPDVSDPETAARAALGDMQKAQVAEVARSLSQDKGA